ncbi:hypothetical protein F4804DRAFT_316296 [Jackrogersella minutella]|nr:hypothetical protein F4804DRAFT_316296 [Jackrogersella minutella]
MAQPWLGSPMMPPSMTPHPMMAQPMMEYLHTSQPNPAGPHDLDDIYLRDKLYGRSVIPLGSYTVSCSFKAIPFRNLGIRYRKLSDYGKIIEEGPEKLIIELNHKAPDLLMQVVKQAWVTKYQEMGVPCRMHFSPAIPYQAVEVTLEREEGAVNVTQEQPVASTVHNAQDDTTLLPTIHEEDEQYGWEEYADNEIHPNPEHNYWAEFDAQFLPYRLALSQPFGAVDQDCQSNEAVKTVQPYPSHGITPVHQEHDDHQAQQGHQASRGYRDRRRYKRRRGKNRLVYDFVGLGSYTGPPGENERGTKRPREDATGDQWTGDEGSKKKRLD